MSYEAEKWARAQKAGKASAKAVLIELAWRRNPDDGKCYPSVETLSESLEMDRKTVMGATAHLEKVGLITKRVVWEGRKKSIYYEFPSFNPEEWRVPLKGTATGSTKTGSAETGSTETGSTKNGSYQEVSTESGTYGGTENGTYGGTENGTVTINKNNKDEQEKIAIASSLDLNLSSSSVQSESKAKISRRKPSTTCPWDEGTSIPDDLLAWSAETYPTIDAREEFRKFVGWALSKDMRYARWDQAFRNWMGNALKYASQRGGIGRGRQPVDRSHFAHEKPMNQKDFSMSERQRQEMERLFALEAEEASKAIG